MTQQQSKQSTTKTKAKDVHTKLMHVQSKLNVPKRHYNSFGKFYYRTTEDVLNALKPILAEYDLTLLLHDAPVEVADRVYIQATAELRCNDSMVSITNTAYAREGASKSGMDEMQLSGAASTYARKYALNGLFLIDDTLDSDSSEQQASSNHGLKSAAKTKQKGKTQSAPEEAKQESDEASKQAYQEALAKFKALQSDQELMSEGSKIFREAQKKGLSEGDESRLRQDVGLIRKEMADYKESST